MQVHVAASRAISAAGAASDHVFYSGAQIGRQNHLAGRKSTQDLVRSETAG